MKSKRTKIFLLLLGTIFLTCIPAFSQIELSQEKVEELREMLIERMDSGRDEVPPIVFSNTLIANAKYENDTIWIGVPQSDFHSADDIISLIYHEYQHHLNKQKGWFRVEKDSTGKIVQWVTDEMYEYAPDSLEVEPEVLAYKESLASIQTPKVDSQQVHLIEQMRQALSKTQRLHFQYAPSNLAAEEILAYQIQLSGNGNLYTLSSEAENAIKRRLAQLEDTYQRRLDYEERHLLGPDGRKT